MAALVDAVLGDEAAAERDGVHYLLLDMCVTLLRWSPLFPPLQSDTPDKILPPEWSSAAQLLIKFLVCHPALRYSFPNPCLYFGHGDK